MKLIKWSEFYVNESFNLSKEFYGFISNNRIDWEEFTDSLYEILDLKGVEISKRVSIVGKDGKEITSEIDVNSTYKIVYSLKICYELINKGNLQDFLESQQGLNTISISIQEMIDRVSDKAKLEQNYFIAKELDLHQGTCIRYIFDLKFQSDEINIQDLQKSYNEYKQKTEFTPEFNKGIDELAKYYSKYNISLGEYLDTMIDTDLILVGFMTDEGIYGIGQYNKKSKKFTIDWQEVENSIEWWNEEYR